MLSIIAIAIAVIASILAYAQARNFVTRRLRYVDAVQSMIAPVVAGLATFVVLLPVVGLLPIVGVGTAASVAISVGTGVLAGARDVKQQLPGY